MSVNTTGIFNPSWFTYKPIDPASKVQGQYAILKPEHQEDVANFYSAMREEHLRSTRELQVEIKATGGVKLTDEQEAARRYARENNTADRLK